MLSLAVLTAVLASANAGPTWTYHEGEGGHWGHGQDQLKVSTTSGLVQGKIDAGLPNVRQFLGIPFAKPPTGLLRWSAPEPLLQPDAEIEATELPPSCNQFLSSTGESLYTREVLEFNLQGLNRTGSTSEDCLSASVWTPTIHGYKSTGGLPVLMYIYGGGFSTGGQDVPYQIPAQWVNRSPNHIVVSFNYRLNIFGFPGAQGLEHQNLGLLDQRAAVEWIRENIAAFGGDPEQMILFGQSAGAGSVDHYNYAYPEDPIVKGLIMESGTALLPIRGDSTGVNFTFVATQLGYMGSSSDSAAVLSYMRSLDASKIELFIANYSDSRSSPGLSFSPIPDGKSVFANYTSRALSGQQSKVPAIIGTNREDGIPFAPYNLNGPNLTLANTAYLKTFFCPATETIRLRQETGRLTYSYRYSGNFSNISPKPWMGAYHSSELPLLFGTHADYRGPSSELEYQTSQAMQDAWVAFAKDPVNGLKQLDWMAYEKLGLKEVREFGAGVAAQDIDLASFEAECDGAVPAA
ncbi:hypothetical protein AC578_4073 [Pseudocercospora eumusae]|uniref:Carboxylic ester hydrolase n=1 Tax=Pseudocercospora eumusae TaxID=321146 RepID=A0A139HDF7_9PEZI|nr:hypothetical protein AC578_4073 [Pseudocercospora eumusae]